ncbi:transcription repressor NadR [Pseudogracilibacillus sp. SO30301A]|uniref:transcription repressor NadR n=1 Tax=Pseudogracilibacillus sp. SO30301A TaxID=3098291 RepID=UPI00300E07A2
MGKRINMTGDERRKYIIDLLKQNDKPLTGKMLAEKTGVSRQVIVTDIALLRTSEEPIIATSRGYLYYQQKTQNDTFRKVIVCKHTPEETKKELELMVDCGVTVVDVIVEHPFYGELIGSLMVKSRYEVEQFVQSFSQNNAAPLLILTGGIHLHTIESDSQEKIDAACNALKKAGILVTDNI